MLRQGARLFIGLGLPFLALVPAVPWVLRFPPLVFGLPSFLVWIWAWMFLSAGCLFACWIVFDRHAAPDDAQGGEHASPETTQSSPHSTIEIFS